MRLVVSDQHAGLVAALRRAFQGVAHQRCRVHFIRNLLAHVPKAQVDMVAAVFRTIFAQPDPDSINPLESTEDRRVHNHVSSGAQSVCLMTTFTVLGRGGVPATNVAAVVFNLTAARRPQGVVPHRLPGRPEPAGRVEPQPSMPA